STAPNARYSATSRNPTRPIRAVSPPSLRNRVFAIRHHLFTWENERRGCAVPVSSSHRLQRIRDEAFVTEQGDDLVHLSVGRGQDQIGVDQGVIGERGTPAADRVEKLG